jgi:hypothetical protein
VITFEEILALPDEESRVRAVKGEKVLYRFGDTALHPIAAEDLGPFELDDEHTRQGTLGCPHCYLEWEAREARPDFFRGLACPGCMILGGSPIAPALPPGGVLG